VVDASVTPRFTRQLGSYSAGLPGPTLVFVGGVHGNEPAGVGAISAVLAELHRTRPPLRGSITGFTGNIAALCQDKRYLTHDLNRRWAAAEIERVKAQDPALDTSEQREQRELLALIEPLMHSASEFMLVDLHSTSSAGLPFSVCGDTLKNRRVALSLPIPLLLGLEESIEGSLCEFVTERGHAAVVVEGGQNRDPGTQVRHEAAIWILLESMGALPRELIPNLAERARVLKDAGRGAPGVIEVTYRHAIRADSQFVMKPGFKNIHTITHGEELARDRDGAIRSPDDCVLLMPLYQGLGDDGFFLGQTIRRSWLRFSAFLRTLGVDRLLTWLPGVRVHETRAHALTLSEHGLARLIPHQWFRLFGYRKVRHEAGRMLFVRRRQ
jgi:hypothetical protein